MEIRFPLRIAVMDDDYFSLIGAVGLLSRDLRTVICAQCDSAEILLQSLKRLKRPPDIVLIDAEYDEIAISLTQLIERTKASFPNAILVCWSQYGNSERLHRAVQAGADAILIKKEVRLALATHLVRAYQSRRVYTPSVANILQGLDDEWLHTGDCVKPWEIHPDLSPRLKQVFWLCIVYGMSVRSAAVEMQVQPETVERYRMKIYDILEDGWVNEQYLDEAWDRIQKTPHTRARGVNWAYHLLTQPPRQ